MGVSMSIVREQLADLLPETDPGACVERHEDERVGSEIFPEAVVEESIWVKFLSWSRKVSKCLFR
jgi:hypothetical protein